MFVVRRPFRNLGKVLTAGTVISDPAVIKHFKSKFAEGKLVKVDEHNFEAYYDFFKKKYGVELPKIENKQVVEPAKAEPVKAEPVKAVASTVSVKPVAPAAE